MIKVRAFTDGSYKHGKSSWAFIIVDKDNNIIYQERGFLRGKINKLHQISGELTSVLKAVEYCIINGYIVDIVTDYNGIILWLNDYFGNGQKPWKPKNIWTDNYREFMVRNKYAINSISKVAAHSGNLLNDYVDNLCKM